MKRTLLLASFLFLPVFFGVALAGGNADLQEKKEGLQELNEFIGQWKGIGSLEENRIVGWREQAEWSWRFKDKDVWLELKIPDGKFFLGGQLRFVPDKEIYELKLTDKEKKLRIFKGAMKGKRLVLEHTDPKSEETQRIQMNSAGDGVRFVYTYEVKPANRTAFYKRFQVGYTKEGESFATAKQKTKCVVTGGLGTMAVSYQGVTYYVCCSGCRDAFNENPEKIIAEYKKKKRR